MSYSHKAGTTDADVIVPDGKWVRRYSCKAGGSGATIIITPKDQSALDTITLGANEPFNDEFSDAPSARDGALAAGDKISFTGIARYWVRYA